MPSVLAIAAHPDDIEFLFAGTMLQLAKRGWDVHYMNLCDGSRGSTTMGQQECAETRLAEAKKACEVLGAEFYPPIYADMEACYTTENLKRVVSAAFSHGMPNLVSEPSVDVYMDPVTVYHAQPIGNRVPTGELVHPHFYVDITDVIDQKVDALACHASQKQWLDESQGQDSYLQTMRDMSHEVGSMSGKYAYAEGWRRRLHWGFCGPEDDPLRHALADLSHVPS